MFLPNGFDKIIFSVQLNCLEKVIDRSTTDGDDRSYRLLVDDFSFNGNEVLAANYVYFKRQHEIIWNGNLFDSIIINRAIKIFVLSR